VAKDAPDEAVDFADQQIFAPPIRSGRALERAAARPMQQVLREAARHSEDPMHRRGSRRVERPAANPASSPIGDEAGGC
jgi:hypothetical protein